MKILNVLAQLPMKTGSGVYFSNLVEELNAQGHENILLYGVQAPYSVDVEGKHYPVEFKSEKIPFPIAGMSDIMPYESTIYSSFHLLLEKCLRTLLWFLSVTEPTLDNLKDFQDF